jgi:hypothetical protein
MLNRRFLFLCMIAVLLSFPARADTPKTCMELLTDCQPAKRLHENNFKSTSEDELLMGDWCTAYLQGVFAGTASTRNPKRNPIVCHPDHVAPERLTSVFIYWAGQHPEQLDGDIAQCASAFVNEVYCAWPDFP